MKLQKGKGEYVQLEVKHGVFHFYTFYADGHAHIALLKETRQIMKL